MARAMDRSERKRYFVGAADDVEELERHLTGIADVERSEGPIDGVGYVVLVRAAERHRDVLAQRLGPNVQVVESPEEAERAFSAAAVRPSGAPYETTASDASGARPGRGEPAQTRRRPDVAEMARREPPEPPYIESGGPDVAD